MDWYGVRHLAPIARRGASGTLPRPGTGSAWRIALAQDSTTLRRSHRRCPQRSGPSQRGRATVRPGERATGLEWATAPEPATGALAPGPSTHQ